MEMNNAKNANIVMAFNLGNDFDHILYAVIKVTDPGLFNVDQFLRFTKTPNTYDALSIDVVPSFGMNMAAGHPPMMQVPMNNPYAFGQFQISQSILMDNQLNSNWQEYYQFLNNHIKSYGDVENIIWFFNKQALHAYLGSQNAQFHQVLMMNHDIFYPAWFEIVKTNAYQQPTSMYPNNSQNGWDNNGSL